MLLQITPEQRAEWRSDIHMDVQAIQRAQMLRSKAWRRNDMLSWNLYYHAGEGLGRHIAITIQALGGLMGEW